VSRAWEKAEKVIQDLKEMKPHIVALSGGVDSSVLTALAKQAYGPETTAATFASPLTPSRDLEDAVRLCELLDVGHIVVWVDELEEVPGFRHNPPDRCYLCKRFRFRKLLDVASELGFNGVLEGSTLSDLREDRPGMRALEELGVVSPLLHAGLTKPEVRAIADRMGLPNSRKPPSACLATRVPYGRELSHDLLRRIDEAENAIRSLVDVGVLRVRVHGEHARIEVSRDDMAKILEVGSQIASELKKLGFRFVSLDLEGYRFGSWPKPQNDNHTLFS